MGRRGGRPGWLPGQGNARYTALLGGAGAVTLLALLGLATGDPFVYPPIGASAFLIFSMPEVPSAAPRNAIGGQVCGVAGGAGALAAFGLLHRHGGVAGDMSGARAGAIGVSLLLATVLMLLFKVSHPAAGATALMISLGIVTSPSEWLELLGAVVLMCAMGVVVNRWAGITYPLWSPPVPVLTRLAGAGRTPLLSRECAGQADQRRGAGRGRVSRRPAPDARAGEQRFPGQGAAERHRGGDRHPRRDVIRGLAGSPSARTPRSSTPRCARSPKPPTTTPSCSATWQQTTHPAHPDRPPAHAGTGTGGCSHGVPARTGSSGYADSPSSSLSAR